MSARCSGTPLWLVLWRDGATLFAGTLEQVVAFMNERHRETGMLHVAREMRT